MWPIHSGRHELAGPGHLGGIPDAIKSIQHRIHVFRRLIARRIAVLLFFLYLAVLVDVGGTVLGDLRTGFYYGNYGNTLFPYPHNRGFLLPVITPVPPIEAFIYAVFVYQGIWIAWTALGIIYIMMPLAIWAYRALKRPTPGLAQVKQEKEEKIGVLTGVLAFLSILFSVATLSIDTNLHLYGFMPFLVALGLSSLLVGVLIQNC